MPKVSANPVANKETDFAGIDNCAINFAESDLPF